MEYEKYIIMILFYFDKNTILLFYFIINSIFINVQKDIILLFYLIIDSIYIKSEWGASLSSSFSRYDLSRRKDRDSSVLSLVSPGDSVSGILGPFDEYSRLLSPVACGFLDGAVRLLTPRHAFLDGDDSLAPGFSRFCWSMFPVLLFPIASLSLALMKIDGGGIDCRWFVLLET